VRANERRSRDIDFATPIKSGKYIKHNLSEPSRQKGTHPEPIAQPNDLRFGVSDHLAQNNDGVALNRLAGPWFGHEPWLLRVPSG
jgi:hypothetical protein